MRKFLVRNFELSTHVYMFGKVWTTLRAPRILFPLTVLMAMVIIGDPKTYIFGIQQVIGLIILFTGYYFGFLHFRFFPYKYEELDEEQKYFYLSGKIKGVIPPYKLTPEEAKELATLTRKLMFKFIKNKWTLRLNLLPLIGSILSIITWYFYWLK